MFKKIMLASVIMFGSTGVFADMLIPYVGADLGLDYGRWVIKDVTSSRTNTTAKGVFGDLFVGAGWSAAGPLYLGLEAFGAETATRTPTRQINTNPGTTGAVVRMRYTYGASLLPGYKFANATLVFLRLSGIRSRFEMHQGVIPAGYASKWDKANVTGGQLGLGLQTDLNNNWAVRGEYDYTAYRTVTLFGTKLTARDNQFKAGVIYNFC